MKRRAHEVRSGSRAWAAYLMASTAAVTGYFALGAVGQEVLYDVIGVAAVAVIAVRVLPGKYQLPDPRPWLLLGLGQLMFV